MPGRADPPSAVAGSMGRELTEVSTEVSVRTEGTYEIVDGLNILLVTYRFGAGITGGAERYLWELCTRLSRRGHRVRVFTTCSRNFFLSPLGYLLWDHHYPPGEREEGGILVARFPVENLPPRRARRYREAVDRFERELQRDRDFVALLERFLHGVKDHCFLYGWRAPEEWWDGPAAWMDNEAVLVLGGESISALRAGFACRGEGELVLEVGGLRRQFSLKPGRINIDTELLGVPALTARFLFLTEKKRKRVKPALALRYVEVRDGEAWRRLELSRNWQDFLRSGSEEAACELLWKWGEMMPDLLAARHARLYGPNSPGLAEAVLREARSADLVMAAMLPMATMEMAWEAARRWNKPLVSIPLFHPRDPNHYRKTAWEAIRGSAGVEVFHEGAVSLLSPRGIRAFGVGPGFDPRDWDPQQADGRSLRKRLGLDEEPVLLWVGRKNEGKGYREAVQTLSILREKGIDAALLMVGPEEDGRPVSREGVFYLGHVDRHTLLEAYAASTLLIHPSIHESFCMVFGEAWLMGKPVLGSAYCAAARSQVRQGENGFLCTDPDDYARRAEWLIRRPREAREMGRRGRDEMITSRGWEAVVEAMEKKLWELLKEHETRGSLGSPLDRPSQ